METRMKIGDIPAFFGLAGLILFFSQLLLFGIIATEYFSTRWYPLWQIELFSYLQIITSIGIVVFAVSEVIDRWRGI